ncbi:type III secretion system outer membrane ring subunit SctC [Endozoicomonadaceae bacterium StTr2]
MGLRDLAAATIMFLLLALPAAQAGSETEHMVLPGQSLSRIAADYRVPLDLLVRYNNLNINRPIQVGQVLMIPPAGSGQQPSSGIYGNMPNMNNRSMMPSAPMGSSAMPPADWHLQGTAPQHGFNPSVNGTTPNNSTLQAFGNQPYSYYSGGEPIADVLSNFASSLYIPVVISEGVSGQVNGRIGPMAPVDFLNHLANIYGYIWYHDGHTLYINASHEVTKRIINLQAMTVPQFRNTLNRMGVLDQRFYWREQPNEGLIYISGPPRYVDMVAETALLLDSKEYDRQNSKLTVRIFKLKYAWATDRSFAFRDQAITVPGVATVLQNIINGGGITTGSTKAAKNMNQPHGMQPAQTVTGNNKGQQPGRANPMAGDIDGTADVMINADPRLNAIIVHDLESRMPMYEELIRSLDRQTSQVEINVSIIDINRTSLDALGVEWSNKRPSGKSEFGFDPFPSGATNAPAFTTVLSGTINSLQAKIEFLAEKGKAKVLSRPSVLTLDNLEAVLDNSSTFYVKVESQEDAQLFPVTYGSVLRVTPRIVEERYGKKIHLSVNVQDGSSDAKPSIDSVVSNSSISTQAVINENESLLIGGFFRESDSETTSKIPVLGDMPVVGALFRSESSDVQQQVRLFLITPRVVNL